jgi:hypothetical protein
VQVRPAQEKWAFGKSRRGDGQPHLDREVARVGVDGSVDLTGEGGGRGNVVVATSNDRGYEQSEYNGKDSLHSRDSFQGRGFSRGPFSYKGC